MLDTDAFAEIWSTLTRHKLRTLITSLSVSWGVFMLIVLLGAGKGLENAATDTFKGDALNSLWISPGTTSVSFGGHGPGRKIKFDNADYTFLLAMRPGVEHVDAELNLAGTLTARYRARRSTFPVRGAVPDVRHIENHRLREGRFLNEEDQRQHRKVAVIGPLVVDVLFDKTPPIGEYIQIRGSNFRIVGVYDDPGNDDDQRNIFVPLSTVQLLSGSTSDLERLGVTVMDSDEQAATEVIAGIRQMLAAQHHYSEGDQRAARLFNNLELYRNVRRMFLWIRAFVWLVGIGTLVAGMVGVSNTMLISVKERTQEIGIRKAIGATPGSVVSMILGESLLITSASGYLGLVAGIAFTNLVSHYMPSTQYLRDPSVDFSVALGATLLIVLAGALAGLFPARQAASTHPITALQSE